MTTVLTAVVVGVVVLSGWHSSRWQCCANTSAVWCSAWAMSVRSINPGWSS